MDLQLEQSTISWMLYVTNTCVADYIEDICPYATFQLSKPPYSESTYSGNVYSGPYHSVRGSFVYHDPKPAGAENYKFRHVSNGYAFTWLLEYCAKKL